MKIRRAPQVIANEELQLTFTKEEVRDILLAEIVKSNKTAGFRLKIDWDTRGHDRIGRDGFSGWFFEFIKEPTP